MSNVSEIQRLDEERVDQICRKFLYGKDMPKGFKQLLITELRELGRRCNFDVPNYNSEDFRLACFNRLMKKI